MKKIKIKVIIIIIILFLLPNKALANSRTSTVVMDTESGRVLYSENATEKKLIASTTKIMTCIIVLENQKLDKIVKIGEEVKESYGTNIYLNIGEEISIKDLLYGLMLRSGNDAAIALATHTFNDMEGFIKKMNDKAKEIGMTDTYFENPHGLDEQSKNYSTAYDMALLSKYALNNKEYKKIISTKKYYAKSSMKSYIWYNRMKLLKEYNNCIGGKNGYTPSAGKTLLSLAKNNNLTLTIVSLDDPNIYNNHKKLYEKYFNQYKKYTILKKQKTNIKSKLYSGEIFIKEGFAYPLKKSEISKIKTIVEIYPSKKHKIIGIVKIKLKEKIIGKRYLYLDKRKKEERKILYFFKNLIFR